MNILFTVYFVAAIVAGFVDCDEDSKEKQEQNRLKLLIREFASVGIKLDLKTTSLSSNERPNQNADQGQSQSQNQNQNQNQNNRNKNVNLGKEIKLNQDRSSRQLLINNISSNRQSKSTPDSVSASTTNSWLEHNSNRSAPITIKPTGSSVEGQSAGLSVVGRNRHRPCFFNVVSCFTKANPSSENNPSGLSRR